MGRRKKSTVLYGLTYTKTEELLLENEIRELWLSMFHHYILLSCIKDVSPMFIHWRYILYLGEQQYLLKSCVCMRVCAYVFCTELWSSHFCYFWMNVWMIDRMHTKITLLIEDFTLSSKNICRLWVQILYMKNSVKKHKTYAKVFWRQRTILFATSMLR